jgi:hypothetical protein
MSTVQGIEQYSGLMQVSISNSQHFIKHCEIHPMTQLKLLVGAYSKGGVKGKLEQMRRCSTAKYLKAMQLGMGKAEYQRQVLNAYTPKQ